MKKIIYRFVGFFVFMISLVGATQTAQAYDNPCFYYNSGWYSTHPTTVVKLSTNISKLQSYTLTNQVPTNLLQYIPFFGTCTMWDGTQQFYGASSIVLPDEVIPTGNDVDYPNRNGAMSSLYINFGNPNSAIVQKFDKIASHVGRYKQLVVRGSGGLTAPVDVAVPMTNCVALAGNGPYKIVFRRQLGSYGGVSEFMGRINTIIEFGFKGIEPFKSQLDKFSFYADLTPVDPGALSGYESGDLYAMGAEDVIRGGSSCPSGIGESPRRTAFVYFFDKEGFSAAWASNLVYINVTPFPFSHKGYYFNVSNTAVSDPALYNQVSYDLSAVTMHELGHYLFGLVDEYYSTTEPVGDVEVDPSNCSRDPQTYFRSRLDNLMYGGMTSTGCGNYVKDSAGKYYYRPSPTSLMYGALATNKKLNVISCGYVLGQMLEPDSGIQFDPDNLESFASVLRARAEYNRKNAEKYWPLCKTLDTDKTSIPAVAPAPMVSKVSQPTPDTFTVSGSGFSPTGNSVKLTYVGALAQKANWNLFAGLGALRNYFLAQVVTSSGTTAGSTYDFSGIPSPDGSTLTITDTKKVISGRYSVSVGAFNSPWRTTSYTVSIVNSGLPEVPTTTTTEQPPTEPIVQVLETPSASVKSTAFSSVTLGLSGGTKVVGTQTSYAVKYMVIKDKISATGYATKYITYDVIPKENIIALGIASSPYTLTNLEPNTKYCFQILSYTKYGQYSNASNQVCPTTKNGYAFTFLTTPEVWTRGEQKTITWDSAGVTSANIKLFKNGNADYTIATGVPSLDRGSYTWKVPTDLVVGAKYTFKIINPAATKSDVTDGYFTVQ